MKLIVLLFTLLVWSNVRDVNKIQLDIKETPDPIIPPKTILIIGDSGFFSCSISKSSMVNKSYACTTLTSVNPLKE